MNSIKYYPRIPIPTPVSATTYTQPTEQQRPLLSANVWLWTRIYSLFCNTLNHVLILRPLEDDSDTTRGFVQPNVDRGLGTENRNTTKASSKDQEGKDLAVSILSCGDFWNRFLFLVLGVSTSHPAPPSPAHTHPPPYPMLLAYTYPHPPPPTYSAYSYTPPPTLHYPQISRNSSIVCFLYIGLLAEVEEELTRQMAINSWRASFSLSDLLVFLCIQFQKILKQNAERIVEQAQRAFDLSMGNP